jgi:hypothetical protein
MIVKNTTLFGVVVINTGEEDCDMCSCNNYHKTLTYVWYAVKFDL